MLEGSILVMIGIWFLNYLLSGAMSVPDRDGDRDRGRGRPGVRRDSPHNGRVEDWK